MQNKERYEEIKVLLEEDQTEKASIIIDELLSENPSDDMAYYLKGNMFRKKQDWQNAINNYSEAIEINPQSPAITARKMCIEILKFYNTDMYNH